MRRTVLRLTENELFYKRYNKNHKHKLEYSVWSKYLRIIIKTIVEYVIKGGYLSLPYSIGHLYIKRKERESILTDKGAVRMRYVDWKETYRLRKEKCPDCTKEYWQKPENKLKYIVFYNNEKTSDYQYKFMFKPNPKMKFIRKFYFKPSRDNSRRFAKYLKTNEKIPTYYE